MARAERVNRRVASFHFTMIAGGKVHYKLLLQECNSFQWVRVKNARWISMLQGRIKMQMKPSKTETKTRRELSKHQLELFLNISKSNST